MPIFNQKLSEGLFNTALFQRIFGKPHFVPAGDAVKALQRELTPDDIGKINWSGLTGGALQGMMQQMVAVNFERMQIYTEVERAMLHPMVGAAMELYADVATTYSREQNATVWVTSENKEYQRELERMLDDLTIEERIFDYAWNVGGYGDLFCQVYGEPEAGVVHIEDDKHPSYVSRCDFNGRLVGFAETPLGQASSVRTHLIPPWEYVHFNIRGAVRRRNVLSSPFYTEFRTMDLVGHDSTRISSRYGTSLLLNALPVYKRLRMAEDVLMIARLSKGLLRYVYKVVVDGNNPDAAAALVDQYATLLKRARAMDLDPNNSRFEDKMSDLTANEDIILPVFGSSDSLKWEKLGGETDIRWIRDIEELKKQLSVALRVPLSMLGDTSDLPGSMGQSALERLDIRFARHARRLQRSVVMGLTRLAQIDLAYKGFDPNERLFNVHMTETSTAEEEELKDALKTSTEVVDSIVSIIEKAAGDKYTVDMKALFDYLNNKVIKLSDFDINKFMTLAVKDVGEFAKPNPEGGAETGEGLPEMPVEGLPPESRSRRGGSSVNESGSVLSTLHGDFKASLPSRESRELWERKWSGSEVKMETKKNGVA